MSFMWIAASLVNYLVRFPDPPFGDFQTTHYPAFSALSEPARLLFRVQLLVTENYTTPHRTMRCCVFSSVGTVNTVVLCAMVLQLNVHCQLCKASSANTI